MLPLAAKLARETGGSFIYDTHELATAEYEESQRWRWVVLPYVRAIEARYIAEASAVSTVSNGIANALHSLYKLRSAPVVVRNVPRFCAAPERPVNAERIAVLYHGILGPGRGLEEMIASVRMWRPEFSLTIRGPGTPSYREKLLNLVRDHQVEARTKIMPPVASDLIVREATKADIGISVLSGASLNDHFALPNKLFEYVMAGLALCVSALPEMEALLRRFDLGRVILAKDAAAIATTLNGLSRNDIERYRANSRNAAHELNWECESSRFLDMCNASTRRAILESNAGDPSLSAV
jgi:glycosyltransferase involved in cell wall biosynthesis